MTMMSVWTLVWALAALLLHTCVAFAIVPAPATCTTSTRPAASRSSSSAWGYGSQTCGSALAMVAAPEKQLIQQDPRHDLPHKALLDRQTSPVVLVGTQEDAKTLIALVQSLSPAGEALELQQDTPEATLLAAPAVFCFQEELRGERLGELVGQLPLTVHVLGEGSAGGSGEPHIQGMTRYTLLAEDDVDTAADTLRTLVAFARKPRPLPEDVRLEMGDNTFFLSLTFPDMEEHMDLLPRLTSGVDAMELRVDLLADHSPRNVLKQLALLRKGTSNMPVVFTIRSKGQCGAFEDDPDRIFELARWGLRAGVEYLDIESNWPREYRQSLISEARANYPATALMGSWHIVGRKVEEPRIRELFQECYNSGKVDAVKVVTTAFEAEDNIRVHRAAQELGLPVPYIGLCLTPKGKLSRVLNRAFTPVTHDELPSVAAPGQLSSKAIMDLRQQLGLVEPRKFHLFGAGVSQSPSPKMHNAAFEKCSLPHHYTIVDSEDVGEMERALGAAGFGGASITIPHKQNVLPLLDVVGEAAQAIGAVNTVVVETDPETGKRVLRGDNTDWLGIKRPVEERLRRNGKLGREGLVALIIGGGGAAMAAVYAMKALGMQVVVYNRTPEKALELAGRFGGVAVFTLEEEALVNSCGRASVDVVVSTIPGAAGFTLPDHVLEGLPIVFEAAYKPPRTALLEQAIRAGCPFVQGADMLVEQGFEQFEIWTKRRAPRDVMREAVYSHVERILDTVPSP